MSPQVAELLVLDKGEQKTAWIPKLTKGRPLQTRAKSRDREIVRAQKKASNGRPRYLQSHVVWSRTLECSVNFYPYGSLHVIK